VAGTTRQVSRDEWHVLGLLGVPTFAFALAITVVTTYLPVHLQTGRASTTTIGLLIGGEGLTALVVPLVVGAWSDVLKTRFGGASRSSWPASRRWRSRSR
jgi:hypothetical protein